MLAPGDRPPAELPGDGMDGVLVIDKPAGPTSHDVVARVRRALRERRIGHTGTLDPLATGVLPLVLGRATRLASLLSGASKTYVAGIRLGCATDTYDAAGRVLGDPEGRLASESSPPAPAGVDAAALEAALAPFRGRFLQAPPAYSAKKIGGVAAYRLARRQQEVTPGPVTVTVTELVLVGYGAGMATVRVTASAGFYVRSLAHDLGAALGCGAHLASLRRTRAGAFDEGSAVPLETVEADPAAAAGRMLPMDALLLDLPAARLTEDGARRAGHGNVVRPADMTVPPDVSGAGRIRLLDPGGRLLALAEARPGGVLQPVVVLV